MFVMLFIFCLYTYIYIRKRIKTIVVTQRLHKWDGYGFETFSGELIIIISLVDRGNLVLRYSVPIKIFRFPIFC